MLRRLQTLAVAVFNHFMRIAHEREQRKLQAEAAENAAPSAPSSPAAQRPGSLTEHLEVSAAGMSGTCRLTVKG